MTKYPHAETAAAKMLAHGLHTAAVERGLSLRQIGRQLGYSQPVVLSHMANGRVPIPIDRAVDIAQAVGMPVETFLEAVLEQRHPGIDWQMITGTRNPAAAKLEQAIGKPVKSLSAEQLRVLREVVADSKPEERWISIPEVAAVKLLRDLFPHLSSRGLTDADREALRVAAVLDAPEQGSPDREQGSR